MRRRDLRFTSKRLLVLVPPYIDPIKFNRLKDPDKEIVIRGSNNLSKDLGRLLNWGIVYSEFISDSTTLEMFDQFLMHYPTFVLEIGKAVDLTNFVFRAPGVDQLMVDVFNVLRLSDLSFTLRYHLLQIVRRLETLDIDQEDSLVQQVNDIEPFTSLFIKKSHNSLVEGFTLLERQSINFKNAQK